jgi:hypothetical protein
VMVCHSVYQCNPKHPFRDNLARSTHGKGFVLTQRVHQAVVDRILSSDYEILAQQGTFRGIILPQLYSVSSS